MSAWRVIITDSESMTGVAPVCPEPHIGPERNWVYDCCPQPHIECWNEYNALDIARLLTDTDAGPCS